MLIVLLDLMQLQDARLFQIAEAKVQVVIPTSFWLNLIRNLILTHFMLGWNRSNSPSGSGISLHHPSGDVMKDKYIYKSITESTGGLGWGNNTTHWAVN